MMALVWMHKGRDNARPFQRSDAATFCREPKPSYPSLSTRPNYIGMFEVIILHTTVQRFRV